LWSAGSKAKVFRQQNRQWVSEGESGQLQQSGPGESRSDASNKNSTFIENYQQVHGAPQQGFREAFQAEARGKKTCHQGNRQAGARQFEAGSRSAGTGSLQAVQARMGRHSGAHSERARHALRLPLLPQVASRSRASAGIQENAARSVEPLASSGGIGDRWDAH
jgi:hypothetical protein